MSLCFVIKDDMNVYIGKDIKLSFYRSKNGQRRIAIDAPKELAIKNDRGKHTITCPNCELGWEKCEC